jgi:23S rRNA (uracil1939-C5)-methyltransferase
MQTKTVTIESFSPSGHGIADNGWYILGAFPGDVVRARQYKFAEGTSYAEILEIVEASASRTSTPTVSPYFDANAPWRYLDIAQENIEKLSIIRKVFLESHTEIYSEISPQGRDDALLTDHYRNKAAYAFTEDNKGDLSFALFARGVSKPGKTVQKENILVHPMINKIGKQFLQFFNQKNTPIRTLKYLTLRYSYHTNTLVAQILVSETNRKKLPWKKSDLEKFQNRFPELQGIIVSHSVRNTRSSATTKDFYITGDVVITEEILGKEYIYHPSQFFQIYPEAFAQILKDCEEIVSSIPNHGDYELLDFFAGIGIIGLHLAHLVKNVHGVEQSPQAGKYARRNAKDNNIENFSFIESSVDQALDHIKSDQILVVDPARSGLTNKSIERITEVQPEYIIYISCNPESQADDYMQLKSHYDIEWSRGYNLFPKTPHVEHVLFLKRKTN